MEFKESQAIIGNPTIKQKLINRIQELEKENFSEVDSEEAIVNMALMNFLLDYKFIDLKKGIIEPEYLEEVDSLEEINVLGKIVKGTNLEGFLTILSEDIIDYDELLNKY